MPAIPVRAGALSDVDRLRLGGWLADFDRSWRPGRLPEVVRGLPPTGLLREVALLELVKIDLAHRGQKGPSPRLADYLADWPELGTPETVPPDLIFAEHQARRTAGEVEPMASVLARYPRQAEQVRALILDLSETLSSASLADQPSTEDHAPPFPLSALPDHIGAYKIERLLGRGGMGAVYLAQQSGLDRFVALKVVHSGAHSGPEPLLRFLREAETMARLSHPNIVQVHEIGAHEGLSFISIEYVEGGTLAQKLRGGPLPIPEAAELVATLARTIQAAHDLGIVHRDLKPANVLLNALGVPKITDFGLAQFLDAEHGHARPGAIVGTPAYMAPEQASGKPGDGGPATDVYALGTILYECLTGQPPFLAESPVDVLLQVAVKPPIPPGKLRHDVPAELEAICLKCLEKAPAARPGSAAELAGELELFLTPKPVSAPPVGGIAGWCRDHVGLLGLLAALLGAVIGALLTVLVMQGLLHD